MTNPFHVDYSSYSGENPADVSPADLTAAWAKFLPHFDGVHHQIGNPIIEPEGDDDAAVQCHGMASHFTADHPGGDLRLIIGTHDLNLARFDGEWKLSMMRFNFKFASGKADLIAETQRRASKADGNSGA